MTARVLVIQHLPHEHAGVLGEVLVSTGCQVTTCRAWRDDVPVRPTGFDAVVVLGGDMNTDEDDAFPHLAAVRALIIRALDEQVPVLGLCLGAQLLAEATGGHVVHGQPEIGWPAVHLTVAGRSHPVLSAVPDGSGWFNAHGDHLTPPHDAVVLARSDATAVHAFSIGSGLGLQFHPEVDASAVAVYVEVDGIESYLARGGWTGPQLLDEARRRNEEHRAAGRALFSAWLGTITGGQPDLVHN